MSDVIKFGTDGWRGVIGEDYTFTNVRRCAQGFASYMLNEGQAGKAIVIGYDKRFASEHFAAAAAEVLAGNGFRVWLTQGATPTPVIAHAIVNKGAAGGINITASHNPPWDNGFKVRNYTGGAIAPEGLKAIEAAIPASADDVKRMPLAEAKASSLVTEFDPAPPYVENLKTLVDIEGIKQAGLRVMVDTMWGNGAGWFPTLLAGGTTEVLEIHNQRNPVFPEMSRPEPIPPNIDVGLQATVDQKADVLLITDGDADRMGLGDEKGEFVNQLRVYALLAYYLLEVRGERGPIVKTLSTTNMLNKLGALYGVDVHDTGVGFKFVAPKMTETNAMIGGEESGGYAFRGNVPERDGILAGLMILDMMVKLGKKPSELVGVLFDKVGAHYYDRVDSSFDQSRRAEILARVDGAQPATVGGLPLVRVNKTDGFKFELEGGSWLLIRFSGTEPIIRVYCETTEQSRVPDILSDGLKIAGLG